MEYASREDMKNALRKLDGTELNGRKLKLVEDRGGGSGGGGGGGGGSRYRRSVLLASHYTRVHVQFYMYKYNNCRLGVY